MISRFLKWLFTIGQRFEMTPVEAGLNDEKEFFVMFRIESGSIRALQEATIKGQRLTVVITNNHGVINAEELTARID